MGKRTDEEKKGRTDRLKEFGFKMTLMKVSDVSEIAELERKSFEFPWSKDSFREIVFSQSYKSIVARGSGGEILGYLVYYTAADEGHIMNVVSNPGYRRMGIARAMLDYVHALLKDSGVKKVFLELRRSNFPAYRLYKKNGYVYIGIRKSYYADNHEDAIIMRKNLV